jgi:hypothetical protein
MAKKQLFIKANSRKNGIVNMRSNCKKCSKEIIIKVEELFRAKEYEPIYELLLNQDGVVEGWAKIYGNTWFLTLISQIV